MNRTTLQIIYLIPLTSLNAELQMKIREVRNEESIRKWMYTDHIISVSEHLGWINRLKQDDRQIVFVVLNERRSPLGLVSVNAIDRLHKKADWAYYLTESERGWLGSAIEFSFIEFVFNTLGMEKLNCEVIEGNDAVIKLHKKFLFKEEGFRRSNIIKNGIRIGVHLLGLTRDDWLAGKSEIYEKYKRVFERLSISIHWQPNDEVNINPIDKIKQQEQKNNLN